MNFGDGFYGVVNFWFFDCVIYCWDMKGVWCNYFNVVWIGSSMGCGCIIRGFVCGVWLSNCGMIGFVICFVIVLCVGYWWIFVVVFCYGFLFEVRILYFVLIIELSFLWCICLRWWVCLWWRFVVLVLEN